MFKKAERECAWDLILISFVKYGFAVPEEVMTACKHRGRKKSLGRPLMRIFESVTGYVTGYMAYLLQVAPI
jgi:hypothetical protein